jgi:hypothetical protein
VGEPTSKKTNDGVAGQGRLYCFEGPSASSAVGPQGYVNNVDQKIIMVK